MNDRIEPLVKIDVTAIRLEVLHEVGPQIARGLLLGDQHSVKAQEHIETNGLHNEDPFWVTMNEEAALILDGDPAAEHVYTLVRARAQAALLDANPLEKAAFEFEVRAERNEKLAAQFPGTKIDIIDDEVIGGPRGEEIINEMAAEHGHESREDECAVIKMLRARREHLLTEHPEDYPG